MKHILIPVDFSIDAHAAAELGVGIAANLRARVTLLYSVDLPHYGAIAPAVVTAEVADAKKRAETQLGKLRDELLASSKAQPTIDILVTQGRPAGQVIRTADEVNADLIVIGSHGTAEDRRFLIGSVAVTVARDAHCPVLLTRESHRQRFPQQGGFRAPLVCIDYSRFSQPAANVAKTLMDRHDSMELIHVIELAEDVAEQDRAEALTRARAQQYDRLRGFAAEVDIAPIAVTANTPTGRIASQILDFIQRSSTQLVVVGAHGRNESATMLGTIADRILRHSVAPVCVVPEALVSTAASEE